MKPNQRSATAYLIAESVVYLSQNKLTESLLNSETVELCRYFADERAAPEKLVYLAKRRKFLRPFFDWLENAVIPGIQLHYALRKRRLEEIARRALGEDFSQLVVFGAGFDCLALRLHKEFARADFVEVDFPSTQIAKRNAVEKRGLAANNFKFVALDLSTKSFAENLLENESYRRGAKTLFVAEGLLMYLEPEQVEDLFDFVFETSAPRSRFAFTFMRRRADGRIAFQNASKLVDAWLKFHGEPFRWGLKPDELEEFLTERNFSFQSLDSDATFRRKYLASPDLKRLPLASGELLCVAETKEIKKLFVVNDIHSKLNETRVAEICQPNSIGEIQAIIRRAASENKSIAVGGGRHAMGGQQFLSNGILLDTSKMNRVLKFEPEKKLVEVEAGIRWNALVEFIVAAQNGEKSAVGIRQKQTGADNLSVGGALAANIHGRGLQMKPFAGDIESFRLVNADGEIFDCSRAENGELFRLAVGGYGLFGVVASIRLRLSERRKLQRFVRLETIEKLSSLFKARIDEGFLYGDFQFAVNADSEDFLSKGVFSCYLPVSVDAPIDGANRELASDDWKNLICLAHADKQRAFELYAAHYLATDRQIYWSDTHQLSVYIDDYHAELDEKLNAACAGSEMITELYVPLEKLAEFMRLAREDFRRNETDLIYGTVRLIKRDRESFLAWARADFACVVFNLHVEHSDGGIERAKAAFRLLIDRAVGCGGSFYLTYHRWATQRQILSCYPQMPEFLKLKMKYDAREVFQSDWYRHCKNLLVSE